MFKDYAMVRLKRKVDEVPVEPGMEGAVLMVLTTEKHIWAKLSGETRRAAIDYERNS